MPSLRSSLRRCSSSRLGCALLIGVALAGCGSPNQANIQLRKEKQALENQVEDLTRERDAALGRIDGLEHRIGTVPTLPQQRLEEMFTVQNIEIGRLTSGMDTDTRQPGDEGVRVHITPVDASGDALKATGHLVVEVFDLNGPQPLRVAHCEFTPAEMKKLWRGVLSLKAFVVTCPWQTPSKNSELVVKVRFDDALTGRRLSAVKQITVKPPTPLATAPTTRPS